ncbi:MAG: ankyrin repeat domain-containing protein [Planctomycetaceae bacterium]|nr:ankyrin repeat domain-containing protein [Planctomycetaceae bacterium]
MSMIARRCRTWIRISTGLVLAVAGFGAVLNLGGCRGCTPTSQENPLDDKYKTPVKVAPAPTPEAIIRGDSDDVAARRISLLIDGGADPNGGESAKRTGPPLISAARMGKSATAHTLISKGANVNAKGLGGTTALHEAALGGSKEVVQELLASGAKVDAKDDFGESPIHRAMGSAKPEIVEMLIAKGANVNAKTTFGTSPIYLAFARSDYEMIELLVKHGADIDAEVQGMTPLASAIIHKDAEMEAFLRRLGAKKALPQGRRAIDPATVNVPRR